MVSRCLFITSSYSKRCLRVSKLRPSTDFWAAAMRLETIFDSIATPCSMPRRCISAFIFAGDKVKALMQRLGMEQGVAIESKMVSKRIAAAQKSVEGRNFETLKHRL